MIIASHIQHYNKVYYMLQRNIPRFFILIFEQKIFTQYGYIERIDKDSL